MSDILDTGTDKKEDVGTNYLRRRAISDGTANFVKFANIPSEYYNFNSLITNTTYEGQWDELGMDGKGKYTFENGVVYIGEMVDSLFDGKGKLHFPSGAYIDGTWCKGKLKEYKIFFSDGLTYSDTNWTYCQKPDRRFHCELMNGLRPAGKSILTNVQPSKVILMGHYDTVDGFYDPRRKAILDPEDPSKVIRMPRDHDWIIKNCRKGWDEPAGPRPDLYESWWPY